MGKLQKKFDDLMSAVTFAEAGEYETARKIMGVNDTQKGSFAGERKKKPIPGWFRTGSNHACNAGTVWLSVLTVR